MNVPGTLLWGFVATTILTTILFAAHAAGLTRMSIPFMLGTMIKTSRDAANAIGFALHFLNGWIFASVYVLAFESLRAAGWWVGGVFGFIHGFFVLLVLLPILPGIHPRMAGDTFGPTAVRQLEPPGVLGLNYGRATPLVTLVAHCVYGIILGAFYRS